MALSHLKNHGYLRGPKSTCPFDHQRLKVSISKKVAGTIVRSTSHWPSTPRDGCSIKLCATSHKSPVKPFYRHNSDSIAPRLDSLIFSRRGAWIMGDAAGKLMERCCCRRKKVGDGSKRVDSFDIEIVVKILERWEDNSRSSTDYEDLNLTRLRNLEESLMNESR